jgi:phage tail sheath protein FI
MIYDRYNAKNRWVPCTGLDAGKYARTHAEREMWMVPAGYTNGVYRRALNVSWLPSEAQRDLLYVDGINFVVSDDGASFVLLGQKTLLRLESDFERMNIRFLSIYLKKNARQYLKGIMFEINDDITRATVRNSLNPFFRDIKTRRGIYEYVVKCDSENNTAEVIDAEELVVTCYVKAAKLAEKIGLFLVYNKTGISFRESV